MTKTKQKKVYLTIYLQATARHSFSVGDSLLKPPVASSARRLTLASIGEPGARSQETGARRLTLATIGRASTVTTPLPPASPVLAEVHRSLVSLVQYSHLLEA